MEPDLIAEEKYSKHWNISVCVGRKLLAKLSSLKNQLVLTCVESKFYIIGKLYNSGTSWFHYMAERVVLVSVVWLKIHHYVAMLVT